MKVTCAAPRDRASSPSAPLPANRSSTRAPALFVISQLNRVSRTRSGVGRISTPSGKRNLRPRCVPPMMRKTRVEDARGVSRAFAVAGRGVRVFPLVFALAANTCSLSGRLPPFGAQAYPRPPTRQVRRIVRTTRGFATGTVLETNSQERAHEEAIRSRDRNFGGRRRRLFELGGQRSGSRAHESDRRQRCHSRELLVAAESRAVRAQPGRSSVPARRLLHADAGRADGRHSERTFERILPGYRAHPGNEPGRHRAGRQRVGWFLDAGADQAA